MEAAAIVVALILSAFFSGSEIAFVVANRLRVELRARRGGIAAPLVMRLISNPSEFLTTTLVGNNLSLVVYSTFMALYLEPPLERFFATVAGFSGGSTDIAVLVLQTLVASAIVLVIGEVLPKSVLRETANRAVFALAVPLRIAYFVLLPFITICGWTASGLVRLLKAEADTLSQFMRRDFELIIKESRGSSPLEADEDETAFVSNVLALSTQRVKESMVPRTDIDAIDESDTITDLRDRFLDTGHSKLPVYRENIDNIVGVVSAYDLFQDPTSLAEILKPIKYVPESKRSKDLLRDFLSEDSTIAIVIDEYGGTAGLVTREDLLEELFGDIQDEFDVQEFVLRQVSKDTFTVSGRVEVDELAEKYGLEFPEGDYETVAGYLLERLGTFPSTREEFELDGFRFVILKASPNRIELVRIVRLGMDGGSGESR